MPGRSVCHFAGAGFFLGFFTGALAGSSAPLVFPAPADLTLTAFFSGFSAAAASLAFFRGLGLARILPWPLRNTAPKGGMRMATEDSMPWDSFQETLQGAAFTAPLPPYSGRSELKTSTYSRTGGQPKR